VIIYWSALRSGNHLVHRAVIPAGGSTIEGAGAAEVRAAEVGASDVGDRVVEQVLAVTSARTRVNEYGGGAIWASGESLYWVEDADQQIRCIDGDGPVRILTPEPPAGRAHRHSGGSVIPGCPWMVVERELHIDLDGSVPGEAINELAVVSIEGAGAHTLARSADFMAEPVVAPDGSALAWLQWNHPEMPWTAAELWAAELEWPVVAAVADGSGVAGEPSPDFPPRLSNARRVAGGADHGRKRGLDRAVSVCLPKWSPDGVLHFCDDSDDLWRLRSGGTPGAPTEGSGDVAPALYKGAGEVGEPRWVAGVSRYGFTSSGGIVLAEDLDGLGSIRNLDPQSGVSTGLSLPQTWIQHLDCVVSISGDLAADASGAHASGADTPGYGSPDLAVAVAGSGSQLNSVFVFDPADPRPIHLTPADPPYPRDSISVPRPIRFPTGGSELAHGLFHEPRLSGVTGPPGEAPPLLVRIHGGPTSMARSEYSASIQFWTMAGFAVLEVNYRGSSGFGRDYRDSLNGQWGVAEVADCINAAEHLASLGRVDPARCVIRGGSAGGFTALEAVCAEPTDSGFRFAAATSLYGVTDLTSLASDTHKFEARYLDGLIGPYPEARDVYLARSPLQHPERIGSPVLILQGIEDRVVPPEQAEAIVAAMTANGVDHEYKVYENEGHGFRLTSTITDAMRREMRFYGRVLGFEPANL
jgi:dienelactone hydrolase